MVDHEIINLTNGLLKNKAISRQNFDHQVAALDCNFPLDYLEFMAVHNGAEGDMAESWLQLWPIEQLLEINKGYAVADYLPEILLVGSNGGGEAFGIRKREGTFIQVPFLFDEDGVADIGDSFKAFLLALNTPFEDRIT